MKFRHTLPYILFSALLVPEVSAAQPLQLDESRKRIGAESVFYYALEDAGKMPSAGDWNVFPRNGMSFSMTDATVYLKFSVTGKGSWYTELPYPPLDNVEFFEYLNGEYIRKGISGDHLPFYARTVKNRNHVFRFDLEDNAVHTYMIKITSTSLMLIEPQIWSQEAFIAKERNTQLMHGLYIGSLIILILYNMFLLFSIKDLTYFYYVGYLIMNLTVFLTFHGFSFEYIWPEGIMINHYAMVFPGILGTAAAVEYSRRLLKISQYSRYADGFLTGYILLLLVMSVMTFVVPIRMSIVGSFMMGILSIILMISFGVLRLVKGYRPAVYFISAWLFFTAASVLHLLKTVGLVPSFTISNHGIMIGTIGQALIFAFALADRINILENEKQESRLLLMQQSRMAVMGEMIGAIAHQWKQPLSHISLLTEEIEDMHKDGTLNMDILNHYTRSIQDHVRFMDETINDFRNYFRPSGSIVPVTIEKTAREVISLIENYSRPGRTEFSVTGDLHVQVLAYPNELKHVILNIINNSLYAVRKKSETDSDFRGMISIEIREKEKYAELIISDNGGGFEESVLKNAFRPYLSTKGEKGTGIGLYLSRMLLERMGGRIYLENKGEKARVTMQLRKA